MKIVYLYAHKVESLFQRLFKEANPLISLISDEELRRRCSDLLAAQNDHDRVIQQACLVLENRVRKAIGADASVVGADLMGQAFNPSSGLLRLSDRTAEQKGIMFIYNGIMAFFRNTTGHHILDTYSQHDAFCFVMWVDLLLKMVSTASEKVNADRAK